MERLTEKFFPLLLLRLQFVAARSVLLEQASTPLPREFKPNYRVVLEVSHFSAEAVADGEEYFDFSTDSLGSNCKKMRLNSCLESLEPETYAPGKETAAS